MVKRGLRQRGAVGYSHRVNMARCRVARPASLALRCPHATQRRPARATPQQRSRAAPQRCDETFEIARTSVAGHTCAACQGVTACSQNPVATLDGFRFHHLEPKAGTGVSCYAVDASWCIRVDRSVARAENKVALSNVGQQPMVAAGPFPPSTMRWQRCSAPLK